MKLDELEIGQRFRFPEDEIPRVYAGESPCGRWFAYWERRAVPFILAGIPHFTWSIEETTGEEEVICE